MELKDWYHDVFLKSPEWADARQKVIERDGRKCWVCGETGLLVVHHIRYGSTWEELTNPDNLVTLCQKCHLDAHQFEEDLRDRLLDDDMRAAAAKFCEGAEEMTAVIQSMIDRMILERNLPEWTKGKAGWTDSAHSPHRDEENPAFDGQPQIVERYAALLLHMSPKLQSFRRPVDYSPLTISMLSRMAGFRPYIGKISRYQEMRMWAIGRTQGRKWSYFIPPDMSLWDAVRTGKLDEVLKESVRKRE